jgi:MFS family permease
VRFGSPWVAEVVRTGVDELGGNSFDVRDGDQRMTAATSRPLDAEAPVLTHRQILVIMSGLMMGMFLASLDQTIVSTALPTIVGDFHRSDLLSWVVTAYLLASTASTPLWGKAGDLYGRKRVFQLAIVVFLLASALCGASQNMYELIAFRGLQGIGGGGLISLVFAIIGDVISPRERGRYQGYFGAVFGVSSVIGPLAGGFAVDSLTWRYIFYINLPLGIAALVVTNRVLRLPVRKRQVLIDWWGRCCSWPECRASCSPPSPVVPTTRGGRGRSSACSGSVRCC